MENNNNSENNREDIKVSSESLVGTMLEKLQQEVYQNALLETMLKDRNKEIAELKKAKEADK